MARARKTQPTLDSIHFSTPEQKVLRLLLAEPTTSFTLRVIASRLKGVRGLGGTEGITKILQDLEGLQLLDFVDNRKAVRLKEDNPIVLVMKTFSAICDLEGIRGLLQPVSTKGILFGSRANGQARTDSDYNLFVVSDQPLDVKRITDSHPMARQIQLATCGTGDFGRLERKDPKLAERVARGIVVWGTTW